MAKHSPKPHDTHPTPPVSPVVDLDVVDDVPLAAPSDDAYLALLPDAERSLPGARLFAEACVRYGLNPDPTTRPFELMPAALDGRRFAYYTGDEYEGRPPRVRLVTAGGLKLAHPMDEDTEDRLRRIFRAYRVDPKTKEVTPLPLPEQLTLPREHVTGKGTSGEHQYAGGYLRSRAQAAGRR